MIERIKALKRPTVPSAVPILFLLLTGFSIAADYFFTIENFKNILLNGSVLSIIALGMSVVMLTNGIDLSVGAMVSFVSIIIGILLSNGLSVISSIGGSLLLGGMIGFLNGILIAIFEFPPFIVTLGTMSLINGMALVFSDGKTIYWDPNWFNTIATSEVFSLPIPFWIVLILLGITLWFFHFQSFGNHIWGIGNNEEALRLVGVNTKLYTVISYVICSLLASISGIITTSRIASGNPTVGFGSEFQAIAAAAIGGISFLGGYGHPGFAIVSALTITVLVNGLNLLGFSTPWQYTGIGLLLIIGMSLNILRDIGKKKVHKS